MISKNWQKYQFSDPFKYSVTSHPNEPNSKELRNRTSICTPRGVGNRRAAHSPTRTKKAPGQGGGSGTLSRTTQFCASCTKWPARRVRDPAAPPRGTFLS